MTNTQILSEFFIYICSRNPIAIWAIEHLLAPGPPSWRFGIWFPKQLLVVPEGVHILLIDTGSIWEWPEAVRKWTDAGHRTILLVAESWDSGGAELRALHLGVRGIVPVLPNFIQRLLEAVDSVAKGQLFASREALGEFYYRCVRPRPAGPNLSFREEQVVDLLLKEFSNRRIGSVLGISERTAKFHVCNILRKLGVRTRKDLLDKYGNVPGQTQAALVC